MTFKGRLKFIQDDLESMQVAVVFEVTEKGVRILAKNEADRLLAKKELNRQGILIAE